MNRPPFIVWHARIETGIAHIDEQHKSIVTIINSFYDTMHNTTDYKELCSRIINTMKTYSSAHFVTEEALLEEVEYKDIEIQKRAHKGLIIEMELIWNTNYEGTRNEYDPRPLLQFLKKWWLSHINEEDQLYAQYIRARDNSNRAQT